MRKKKAHTLFTAMTALVVLLANSTMCKAAATACIGKFASPIEVSNNPLGIRKVLMFIKCNEEHSLIKMKPIAKKRRQAEIASFGKLTRVKNKEKLQEIINELCYSGKPSKCNYTKLYSKYEKETRAPNVKKNSAKQKNKKKKRSRK